MPARVLLYSHDTVGLGHSRRILAIARSLTTADPELTGLLVTGSSVAQMLRYPPNVDFLKLPSVRKQANDAYEARRLAISRDDVIGLRSELLRETFDHFAPHLVVVDKAPLGVHGDLRAMLEMNAFRARRSHVVLSLRDILDEPAEVIGSWTRNGIYDALDRLYDHIIVWGMREVFDAVEAYRIPEHVARKVVFCGYLQRSEADGAPHQSRERSDRVVLVTAGGGEDGFLLLDHFIASLPLVRSEFTSVVLLGPDMPDAERAALRTRAAASPRRVIVLDFTSRMERVLAGASLVVSMAGYNTVCEVLAAGKPSIVVPRIRPRLEQLIRARAMEARGLLRVIDPRELSPGRLAAMIDEELGVADRSAGRPLDFGGLRNMLRLLAPVLQLDLSRTEAPATGESASLAREVAP